MATLRRLLTPARRAALKTLRDDTALHMGNRDVSRGAFPTRPWEWNLETLPREVAELNSEIDRWAIQWNIRTDWVLRVAALTLQRLATRPILRRRARSQLWLRATESRSTQRKHLVRRRSFQKIWFATYDGNVPTGSKLEKAWPFEPRENKSEGGSLTLIARDKKRLGEAVATINSESHVHLVSFVRWQVCGDGVDLVAQRWAMEERRKVPPTDSTVIQQMRAMAKHFSLKPRPNRRPGRPRRSS